MWVCLLSLWVADMVYTCECWSAASKSCFTTYSSRFSSAWRMAVAYEANEYPRDKSHIYLTIWGPMPLYVCACMKVFNYKKEKDQEEELVPENILCFFLILKNSYIIKKIYSFQVSRTVLSEVFKGGLFAFHLRIWDYMVHKNMRVLLYIKLQSVIIKSLQLLSLTSTLYGQRTSLQNTLRIL